MIATTNLVLLASVLASAGLFAAYDGATFRKDEAPAAFADRFPRQEEMFKPVVRAGANEQGPQVMVNRARKGDKIAAEKIVALSDLCAKQQWPYIDPECLQRADGSTVRSPTRTIYIERRTAESDIALGRLPAGTLVLR
jgi:hypothetical protein